MPSMTISTVCHQDDSPLSAASLESHRISKIGHSMYYIPDFISVETQAHILGSLPAHKWTYLTRRRLQAHPSALTKSGTLLAAPLAPCLSHHILDHFDQLGIFSQSPHGNANHCLVNEYEAGQGIMMHEDGASYYPCTATVSLGGTVVLDVVEKANASTISATSEEREADSHEARTWRILQEPGSLLVTTHEIYSGTLHGIAEVSVDEDLNSSTVANWELLGDRSAIESNDGKNVRTLRTSLTYRDVLKVSNAGQRILGLSKRP